MDKDFPAGLRRETDDRVSYPKCAHTARNLTQNAGNFLSWNKAEAAQSGGIGG